MLSCSQASGRFWITYWSLHHMQPLALGLWLKHSPFTAISHGALPGNHVAVPVGSLLGDVKVGRVCGISSCVPSDESFYTVCLVCIWEVGHCAFPSSTKGPDCTVYFFSFNWYQCSSHQRLLCLYSLEAEILMQIMLMWTLIIIYWSFLNSIFNIAKFERGWWWRNKKCSPWQRFRGSFGHLCLRARMLLPVWFLPQNSWVHLLILGKHLVDSVFLQLAARTEQEAGPLAACDLVFPLCLRHSGVLGSRARV